MNTEVLCALIAMIGCCVSPLLGILVSSKLTNYRVEQLEKKLDEYRSLNDRIYALEKHDEVLDTRLGSIEQLLTQRLNTMQDRQEDLISDMHKALNGGTLNGSA